LDLVDQEPDEIVAGLNLRFVDQGLFEPAEQEPRADGGLALVEKRVERHVAIALLRLREEVERAHCRAVELHVAVQGQLAQLELAVQTLVREQVEVLDEARR